MWPLLLLVLFTLGWGFYLLNKWQQASLRKRAMAYRVHRLELLASLESVAASLSSLEALIPYLKLGEASLLDAYETELRMFESTLTAAQKLAAFGFSDDSVRQLANLAHANQRRVRSLHDRFRVRIENRVQPWRDYMRWTFRSQAPTRGCYFCSRPFSPTTFKIVRSIINGVRVTVYGCDVCRAELAKTQSAKVLHFMVKGQAIHWEQVKDYAPLKDFWDLNRKQVIYQRPKLELLRFDKDV